MALAAKIEGLLPESLSSRVLYLHVAAFVFYSAVALFAFVNFYIRDLISQELEHADMIVNLMVPAVTDSAVIGDHDTIKKMLERAVEKDDFSTALYLDVAGPPLVARNTVVSSWPVPFFVSSWLEARLADVSRPISAGGRDYGVLRLTFNIHVISNNMMRFVSMLFLVTFVVVTLGLVAIGFPLRRWLQSLSRVSHINANLLTGELGVDAIRGMSLPVEIRQTMMVLAENAEARLRQLQAQTKVIAALQGILNEDPSKDPLASSNESQMALLTERVRMLVTDREVSRVALSNQKYALDQHAMVTVHDMQDVVTYVNQRFIDFSGLAEKSLVGRKLDFLYSERINEPLLVELRQAIDQGRTWLGEMQMLTADGRRVWHTSTAVPLVDIDGKINEYIMIHTNITSQKEAQESLRHLNDSLEMRVEERTRELVESAAKLEEALDRERDYAKMQERLAGMISHEFRTPLSVITGATELIGAHLDSLDDAQRKNLIQRMRRACFRMTGMLEDALTIGRLTGKNYQVQFGILDLPKILEEIVGDVRMSGNLRRQYILEIAPVPAGLQSDEKLIHQVVSNLVSNADKYSTPDKPIVIKASGRAETIKIEICDESPGISEDDLQRLFEPFFRGANSGLIPGTGLGLAICRSAADLLGGEIRVESVLGKGTTASLTIPCRLSGGAAA